MDLPNLFTVNVAQAGQRVCVLVVTDQTVLAGLLVVHTSGSQLLSISEQIAYTDDDSFLIAADDVLQELGKQSEDVNEVVFCLEGSWIAPSGELVVDKQALLKRVKDELSLEPVGYVLQHETITEHLIAQQRQLSAVVLFLSTNSIAVTHVQHGVAIATVSVGRSGEIQSDVIEALTQLVVASGKSELPGKLLCATIALEVAQLFELQQELITVVWPESIKFLQSPVVEVIKPQLAAQIVATGAGKALQQLEQGLVGDMGSTETAVVAETAVAEDVQDMDESLALTESATASSFGVPIKTDPVTGEPITAEPTVSFAQTDPFREFDDPTSAPLVAAGSIPSANPSWIARFKNQGKPSRKRALFIIGLAAALGLAVALIIGYFLIARSASIQLIVIPKTQVLTKEVQLTLDPTLKESDVANQKLRAEKIEVEQSDTAETQATGIKIVGEKAKGSVIVFNKTSANKSFPAGTIFKSGKLEYSLDQAVEVPAASVSAKPGGTGEEKEYGQRSGALTATVIGVENNIDKDVSMAVADFDEGTYSAKTETSVSGGSSREVRVISQADLDVLLSDLKNELLKKAKQQFEEKQVEGQRVIPLDAVSIVSQKFSAKDGDEVDKATLDLTIKATGLAYFTDDLQPIAQTVLSSLVPSGFSLEGHTPQILSAGTASGSSQVRVSVNLSSKAHALIEVEQLKQAIANQTLERAAQVVESNGAVAKARFMVSPNIARLIIKKVPAADNRLSVEIEIAE